MRRPFRPRSRQRGFTVHDDSRTNYLLTRLVVPTMFDSAYIEDIPGLAPPFGPDQAVDARRLREAHGGDRPDSPTSARRVTTSCGSRRAGATSTSGTWIAGSRLPGRRSWRSRSSARRGRAPSSSRSTRRASRGAMRDRINAAYASATALAAEPHTRPRFVFVHVPAPHPPTVFRADGSPENGSPDAAWDVYRDPRRDQGGSSAARLRAGQGDRRHDRAGRRRVAGRRRRPRPWSSSSRTTGRTSRSTRTSRSDRTPTERSSNFLATLTPGHPDLFRGADDAGQHHQPITNAYLGTSVPRQPDRTYAYKGSVLNTVPIDTTPAD